MALSMVNDSKLEEIGADTDNIADFSSPALSQIVETTVSDTLEAVLKLNISLVPLGIN